LNQTNNSFIQPSPALNDEAMSALSSYYMKERESPNKKGAELPTEMVLMYLRAKQHRNEVENAKVTREGT